MGHFFDQFVPAGVDPGLFVVGVIAVLLFVAGVVFLVVGRMDEPTQTTLPPLEHPPPRKRLEPGLRMQREWQRYLQEYQARGGLGSPLAHWPDEWSLDAFLRDAPQAAPSGGPLASAAEAKGEQAPTLPPNAAPLPHPAPGAVGPSHPPLPPFPVASEPALPPRPAGSVPLAFQPGGPPWKARAPLRAPGFDEEAKASPEAAEEPAVGDEENEADGWDASRPWVILPSRFPLVPSTEERPAASARPEEERPAALTTVPSPVGLEPAPKATPAAEADPSGVSAPSHDAARLSQTLAPSRAGVDAPASAKAPAPSSPLERAAAPALPSSALEEAESPDLRRREAAEAEPAPLPVRSAEPAGLRLSGEAGSLLSAEPALLEIHGFGEAHLVVNGQVVLMRKATKELELALYLAHQAAEPQAQGKEIPFTYRATLADTLWPMQPEEDLQAQSLKNTKLHLCRRLRSHAPELEEAVWLESRQGKATLRLAKRVATDLAAFLRLTGALAQAARSAERSRLSGELVEDELSHLHHLYQGGFGLQFRDEEWAQSARAGYRQQYLDALFDVACLLAPLGRRRRAILLTKDLLLEEDVSADTILPVLLGWLEQEGGKGEVAQWWEEYRRRYQYKFQRSLAEDRPDQEALFRQALASGR